MRILHVITSLQAGGAEKIVTDFAIGLTAKGHCVEVVSFDGSPTILSRTLENEGIKIHHFHVGGNVYRVTNIWKLWKIMRQGWDIVHTHNTAPQMFAAVASLFCSPKLVTTEHSTSTRRRAWKWFSVIDNMMYSRYSRIICISKRAEETLREFTGIKSAKAVTINNGIDFNKYANGNPIENFSPEGTKAITMVAAFRWEKDQPTAIKALKYLPEHFHLYLVGKGQRAEEFQALTISLNLEERVHFLGLRNDVPDILAASDYVVMSSHFEGLSLSSLEGMACGKPFFASDVNGLREVVSGAGVLFQHENSKELANKILEADSNPDKYQEIANQCRARAKEFDISKTIDSYNRLYLSISK